MLILQFRLMLKLQTIPTRNPSITIRSKTLELLQRRLVDWNNPGTRDKMSSARAAVRGAASEVIVLR